jgi:hypothetical protein
MPFPILSLDETSDVAQLDIIDKPTDKDAARTWFWQESGLTPEVWVSRLERGDDLTMLVKDELGNYVPVDIITEAARALLIENDEPTRS